MYGPSSYTNHQYCSPFSFHYMPCPTTIRLGVNYEALDSLTLSIQDPRNFRVGKIKVTLFQNAKTEANHKTKPESKTYRFSFNQLHIKLNILIQNFQLLLIYRKEENNSHRIVAISNYTFK